jgi:flagellar motor component MotA
LEEDKAMVRFVFLVLSALCLVGVFALLGGGSYFVVPPTMLAVLLPGPLLTAGYHGPRRLLAALRNAFSRNPDESAASAHVHRSVLQTLRGLVLASGSLGLLIGLVLMLARLDDPKTILPAAAVALLSPLYAFALAEIVLAPLIRPRQPETLETSDEAHLAGYRQADNAKETKVARPGAGALALRWLCVLLGFMFFAPAILLHGSLSAFLSAPAALLVIGTGVLLTTAIRGPQALRAALGAAYRPRNCEPEDLQAALAYVVCLHMNTARSGVLAVAYATLGIMHSYSDPSRIGPYMALGLLGLFYAIWLAELVLVPLAARLARHLGPGSAAVESFIEKSGSAWWPAVFTVATTLATWASLMLILSRSS